MHKSFIYSAAILASAALWSSPLAQQNTRPVPDANGYDAAWYDFPANTAANTHFDFDLKGYVFGIRVISGQYEGALENGEYNVRSVLRTAGLGALLKKLKIWAVTHGRYDRDGLFPRTHTQQNLDKKSRRVEMAYRYGKRHVRVKINPPIGSQGVPPATPKERFEADDTLSAVLNLMMRQTATHKGHLDAPLCSGDVKVFDSKQHYALRMTKGKVERKKYFGEKRDILNCNIYYVPISGFDPEDLPEKKEANTPIKVQLLKNSELDMYIPVRLSYRISGFNAVIKLSDMHVNGREF